jgi:NTP pyrophosphatase (non-canonical NTP hydrolase)
MGGAPGLTFRQLQHEVAQWALRNFGGGDREALDQLLGMGEELGELDHAILKQRHGIRGDWEQHEAEAKDAFGDLMIFAMDFAARRGWDAEVIVSETWSHVQRRDWVCWPIHGGEAPEAGRWKSR